MPKCMSENAEEEKWITEVGSRSEKGPLMLEEIPLSVEKCSQILNFEREPVGTGRGDPPGATREPGTRRG